MIADHENTNGLVDGNIPKGDACPFISFCPEKRENCPTVERPKGVNFSCGLARFISMVKNIEKAKEGVTE